MCHTCDEARSRDLPQSRCATPISGPWPSARSDNNNISSNNTNYLNISIILFKYNHTNTHALMALYLTFASVVGLYLFNI